MFLLIATLAAAEPVCPDALLRPAPTTLTEPGFYVEPAGRGPAHQRFASWQPGEHRRRQLYQQVRALELPLTPGWSLPEGWPRELVQVQISSAAPYLYDACDGLRRARRLNLVEHAMPFGILVEDHSWIDSEVRVVHTVRVEKDRMVLVGQKGAVLFTIRRSAGLYTITHGDHTWTATDDLFGHPLVVNHCTNAKRHELACRPEL